jgi:hypothetical protein
MTTVSPVGGAVAELAADAAVQSIVGLDPAGVPRVRSIEPAAGDALGPGKYIPFVVVTELSAAPMAHIGVRSATLGIRAYAATYALAEALWLACEAVFRDRLARITPARLGVYHSQVISSGPQDQDPDTKQPLFHGVVSYPTMIGAVPV